MFKSIPSEFNFIEMEKLWLKHWYEKGILQEYLNKNKRAKKKFSFLDGPITANNPMGVHHAWGRTYKDLWQKFNNLLGKKQHFQNGFDCQGLWVEVEVEKELGLKGKKEIENLVSNSPTSPMASLGVSKEASIAKFIGLCKERVYKYAGIQTEQSKRLGYFMDWENSYFTMSPENNYMIWHFLKKCYENGWIYKGHESVPWCPRCETAISQHEMLTEDYKEVVHEAIYFELKIRNPKSEIRNGSTSSPSRAKSRDKSKIQNPNDQNEYLLIWTTTPWTIPANIAVAIDVKLDYSLVEVEGERLWLAKDRIDEVVKVCKAQATYKVLKTVKGKDLVGLQYQSPFDDLPTVARVASQNPKTFHTVIATDDKILPISTEEGTGLVHTAVSAGVEDFKLGKKLGLSMIPVIADNADYLPTMGILAGKNAKRHPEIIFDYLLKREKQANEHWVFEIHKHRHRYPACWRCKTELVWKMEDEWYIAMDKPSQLPIKSKIQNPKSNNLTLRKRMMNVAKKITWMPEFGLERELDWLKNMHDWLISKKNRYWGLALPIYECKKCGNFAVIGSKEELKKRAVKGWQEFEGKSPHKPYIDKVIVKCNKCQAKVRRIDDVGNPWLDAGIVPYSTITENNTGEPLYFKNRKEWQTWFPADFITESFPGQFKNWFYALIAMSTVLEDTNPYKTVLGFGTLLGEDGRPMHKSWGNSIEFNEGADKIGADVMRWMYVRHNPAENLLFGYKKADEVRRQFYLMFWNVYRFFVEYANLDKYIIKISNLQSPISNLNILDKWMLSRFILLVQFVEKSLKEYNAKDAALEIEQFVNDLSTWYIRRSRGRVWLNSEDEKDKEAFYSTLYIVLVNLSIILSPFLPFISEEIYTNLTNQKSVHLSFWPDFKNIKIDQKLLQEMKIIREIVEVGHRTRKELKIKVRQPLQEALITLKKGLILSLKKELAILLESELNIKKISWKEDNKASDIQVIFDTKITDELKKEGTLRDLIRQIQRERKKLGLKPTELVNIVILKEYKSDIEYIKTRVLAKDVMIGERLEINKT